jgi:hypothetical protein
LHPDKNTCSFRHLERMTDDTGMLEHSTGIIPNRQEGYSTDDNARALWACLAWLEWLNKHSAGEHPEREKSAKLLMRLSETYIAFMLWAQQENGWLHNNFAYDRTPEPEMVSEDCQGRALWAAAVASTQMSHPGLRIPGARLLMRGWHHAENLTKPRGWAWSLAACSLLLAEDLSDTHIPQPRDFRLQVQSCARELESRLLETYRDHAQPGWRWFEQMMTYGNGVLPWSLFKAYEVTGNRKSLETAREALDFLADRMTAPEGWVRPVGNHGWATKERQSQWDQQPLDVMKLGLAAEAAYLVTGRSEYKDLLTACRDWFLGRNDKGVPMADPADGSCQDGLTPDGPNSNRGAESTLSYLLMEVIFARTNTTQLSEHKNFELISAYRNMK